jgi:hypothetical protein
MLRRPFKSMSVVIVLWLALLQVFAPFIHGHLELNAEDQGHGLHMHAVDIDVPEMHTVADHVSMGHAALHTVTMEHGLKNDQDLLIQAPLMALIFLLLLALPASQRLFPPVFGKHARRLQAYSPYLSRAPPAA